MESLLADGKMMELLETIESMDNSLGAKVKRFFRNIADLIRQTIDAYKGFKSDSTEGRLVLEMKDIYGQLQELFAHGIYQGGKNHMAMGTQKNSTQEGGEAMYFFRGENKDGIEVYETSEEIKKLPYTERQQRFFDIMKNEYRGRTAKFVRNGHAYYATFEESDVNKNIYGDKRSDPKGWKAKINVGADGNIFELVENARYNGSKPEKGKKIAAHRGVGFWDYFIKNVQIDDTVNDLVANVRKKSRWCLCLQHPA